MREHVSGYNCLSDDHPAAECNQHRSTYCPERVFHHICSCSSFPQPQHEEPGPRRSAAIPSVCGSVQGAETRGFSGNSDYTQRSSEDWAEKSDSTDSDTVSACSDRDESFGDYDELSDRSSGSEDSRSLSGQEDDYNDQSEDEDGDDDGSDDY